MKDHLNFMFEYESWYTRSFLVIKQLIPHRAEDFERRYHTIERLCERLPEPATIKITPSANLNITINFLVQIKILSSSADTLDDTLAKIKDILQADLFNSELDAAMHLHKNGHLRAAGTVAAVVLESHLQQVAANRCIPISKKDPTIADLNEPLRAHSVYDIPTWREIQKLADIRNLCDHKKARDPTEEEVLDLINGVGKIIQNVG